MEYNFIRISVLCALLCYSIEWASASGQLAPVQFGAPIIAGDRIVFSGPNLVGASWDGIICIDRKNGKRLWKIPSRNRRRTEPLFVFDNHLVAILGSDLYACSLESGRTQLLYRTGYEECELVDRSNTLLVLQGEKAHQQYVVCVNTSTWAKVWERERVLVIREAIGTDALLCQEETSGGLHGYSAYQALAAVSRKDGETLWRKPESRHLQAAAVSNYFLVRLEDALYCWDQVDGATLKKEIVRGPIPQTWEVRGGQLLVWWSEESIIGRKAYRLSAPDLQRTDLSEADLHAIYTITYEDIVIGTTKWKLDAHHANTGKKLWENGPNYYGWDKMIHEGLIYFSTLEPDRKHTTIYQLDVKSGKRKKLYKELVPSELLVTE